jgi:hypothetical protein
MFCCQLNQDALYNSFMHADQGMKEVLHQILKKNWMVIHNTTPRSSTQGWQAGITLSPSTDSVQIFGETILTSYMSRDSE